LEDNIVAKIFFNLHDRRPKNGLRSSIVSSPERGVVKVFGFENRGEERIFVISNVISGTDKEASVHSVNAPDAKTTIVFALTNVVPRSIGNRRGGVILLNTRPPESSDDRSDFLHKSFGEKNSRHVVDWY